MIDPRGAALAAAFLLGGCTAASAQRAPSHLATEWILAVPSAEAATGTFPQSARLTADGRHVVITEAGAGPAAVRIIDSASLAQEHVVALRGVFGDPLPDTAGAGVWVATGGADSIVHIDAAAGNVDRTIALPQGFWPVAIARSPDGSQLAVSGDGAAAVAIVDTRSNAIRVIAAGKHPAGLVWTQSGTIYTALWGEDALAIIDTAAITVAPAPGNGAPAVRASVSRAVVGRHPERVALSPDGRDLYISLPDEDAIAWYDTRTARMRATVNIGLFDSTVTGASPSALAFSPDGSRLYAACGAANALAVFRRTASALEPIGAVPAGWYPSAVDVSADGSALFVANAKGDGAISNPGFVPNGPSDLGYIPLTLHGTLWRLSAPTDREAAAGQAAVIAGGPPNLRPIISSAYARQYGPESSLEGRSVVRAGGPIKHVIYVIKENRTYDQVLGDIETGYGDPRLTIFGDRVTPNQHAIARRFGLFDFTFADAQVSADGHNWSTAAFANDYVERMWPTVYGGRRKLYDFEDGADAAVPHGGYLWDNAARAGLSLRNYGEFVTTEGGRSTSSMPELAQRTDPDYPGFDLKVKDADRFAEWKREFERYEAAGTLPALEIVRLPNDHTAGTRTGAPQPEVYVADNDAALGALVDTVSHSKFWASTAIFAIEDDAQNGPDHVDAQRTTFYLASPYAKPGPHHVRHSTAGVLRTIELILGLEPMSLYDAASQPLYDAFSDKPDLRPYSALPPGIPMSLRNSPRAYRAADSDRFDLSRADAVPEDEFNDVLWHAMRGAEAPFPRYAVLPPGRGE